MSVTLRVDDIFWMPLEMQDEPRPLLLLLLLSLPSLGIEHSFTDFSGLGSLENVEAVQENDPFNTLKTNLFYVFCCSQSIDDTLLVVNEGEIF